MASIGTFGSFMQAQSGIYAAQKGMSVTGNNIANINTPGYTRQRLEQTSMGAGKSDRFYSRGDVNVGNGVQCVGVSQLRDPYLDIRFRNKSADVGSMHAKLECLKNVQDILDEVGKGEESFGIIEQQFNDFVDQLEQMIKDKGGADADSQVRASAEALTRKFRAYASQLEDVKKNTLNDFNQNVKEVNNILTKIRDLNATIRKSEIHGDMALELRDERNLLIDNLSEYMKINVRYETEDIGGGMTVEKLVIALGDANPDPAVDTDTTVLVDGIYAGQLIKHQVPVPNTGNDKDKFPYLDEEGNPTAELAKAKMQDSPTFEQDLMIDVSELKDENGHVLYSISKGPQTAISREQFGNGEAITTEAVDGIITIITKQKLQTNNLLANTGADAQNKPFLMAMPNPNFNPDLPQTGTNLPYLMAERNPKFDPNKEMVGTNLPYLANGQPTKDETAADKVPTADAEQALTEPTNDATKALKEIKYIQQVYTKTPSTRVALDDNDMKGVLQSQREFLTEEGEFTSQDIVDNVDEAARSKRGIAYYQKSLDLLARQFANVFNDANQGFMRNEKDEYITPDGKPVVYTDPATGKNVTLTTKMQLDDAQKAFLEKEGHKVGSVLFSNSGDNNDPTNITAANISISQDWSQGPKLVNSFVKHSITGVASTDTENLRHMLTLMDKPMDFLPTLIDADANNTPLTTGSFQEMWVNIGTVLGGDMSVTNTMLDMSRSSALSLSMQRDSVSTVDLNDEAMNLMQYSKSYNAACRLMTTLDSMLEKLINGTGLTT